MASSNMLQPQDANELDRAEIVPPSADPRRVARQLAVQFLYQLEVQKGANLNLLDTFLKEYSPNDQSRQLAKKWILQTWKNNNRIDRIIRQVSLNWQLSRISQVDRSNLRLAVSQLIDCPDIPPKVVINEAIELARLFSTAQAPAFVNGVLDAIMKEVRPNSVAPNEHSRGPQKIP